MLSKIHLKYRIFLGFLVVSLFVLIVGGLGYFYLKKTVSHYEHVVSINMAKISQLGNIENAINKIQREFTFIVGFRKGYEEDVKASLTEIGNAGKDFTSAIKEYKDIVFVPGEEALYEKLIESTKKLKGIRENLVSTYQKDTSSEEVLKIYFKEYNPAAIETIKAIENLKIFHSNEAVKWSKESSDTADFSIQLSIVLMIIGFIVSLLVGSILMRTLTGQLSNAINELNQSTPELTNSASLMSSLSTELSSCSTEQAAAVQETAASLEEISAMVRRNSDNASDAKASSTISLESVRSGQHAVANMLTAMDEINQNNDSFNSFMEKNNSELSEMVKVITNISEKTKVINDIVFQTKLLSFNASVEAARAGEQGKGFAVVAEEVGNLAQMSGNAASEIKGLLDESIHKVNGIVSSTKSQVERLVNEGKNKIELGIERAKDCNSALDKINIAVSSVESLVTEVALASGEQSQGIEEVNKAMGQIDEVTNQNTIASQSVSANSAQVALLASSIKMTSDKLTQLLTGKI